MTRRTSPFGIAKITLAALAIAGASMLAYPATSAEDAVAVPPPSVDLKTDAPSQKAIFAGGCFWGVQGVFQHVKGVTSAVSGYAGGEAATADYGNVSSGTTGHAESVEVTFNPKEVSYGTLLQIFFSVGHNPTQLNYQGPDHGTQYRSEIFATTPEQKEIADRYIAELDKAKVFAAPLVTKTEIDTGFYPAEREHQDFLTRNPTYPYIVYNDMPKIENLKVMFPAAFRALPVLVLKENG